MTWAYNSFENICNSFYWDYVYNCCKEAESWWDLEKLEARFREDDECVGDEWELVQDTLKEKRSTFLHCILESFSTICLSDYISMDTLVEHLNTEYSDGCTDKDTWVEILEYFADSGEIERLETENGEIYFAEKVKED